MTDYPDEVNVDVYSQSAFLSGAAADVEGMLNLKHPGIHRTHEIVKISGHNGLPHSDYGFTIRVTLRRNPKLDNKTERIQLAG